MTDSDAPTVTPLAVPGAVIAGKYRLDACVGYGGMGAVWAATHLGLGHQVAIKLIAQAHIKSKDVRRRFDTEAKAVARLKSRHVVQVYDNGELEDGTPYIAMELLQGESLHRRIHRTGAIPLPEATLVIHQVCRALTKAHTAGIIHRDIKPDNIFLATSEEDGGYIAKVLDFGVAKLAPSLGAQSSTQTGSLVGTPLYMSPEQARGLKNIDQRTDLYSLALVAFTMLSGNLAFSGESFGDLLLKICTQPLPSLRQAAPWLPPAVEDWFHRAAAREPHDRFSSAQEMADALAVAAGGSIAARDAASVPDPSGSLRAATTPVQPLADSGSKPYARAETASEPGTFTGAEMQTGQSVAGLPRTRGAVVALSAVTVVLLAAIGGYAVLARRGAAAPPASGYATITQAPVLAAPAAPEIPLAPSAAAPVPSATASAHDADAHGAKTRPAPPKPKPTAAPPKPTTREPETVDLGY